MACHLKDQLFHETTYSKLMVAARKVESEMEDAKEKVRARSSAATEVTDSSKELGDQITRLIAALTRAEQGTCHATTPTVPGTGVTGEGRWTGILLLAPAPTMVRLSWVKAPPLTAFLLQVE